MLKLKPTDLQVRRAMVQGEISKATKVSMLKPPEVAKRINMPESSYYQRLRETENIRLGELWRMARVLHLTDEQLLRIAKGGGL